MKKIIVFLMILILMFSVCACGQNEAHNQDSNISDQNTTDNAEISVPDSADSPADTQPAATTCVHTYADATCTTPKTCSKCGEIEGEAAGHQWKDATCTTPKTCSVCGTTDGGVADHKWKAADCTAPKTCSWCGATEGEEVGHQWKDATCTTPKTCSACGTTEGKAAGHKWKDANCIAPKTCSKCNATEGGLGEHKWNDATCAEPTTCSVCKITEGTAVDHSFGSDGKCKWCKQVLPVSITNLKNKTYRYTKLSQIESEYGTVDAIFEYSISFEYMYIGGPSIALDGDCGICEGRDEDWLDSHRKTYDGKAYYSWGGGFSCDIESQTANNHVIVRCTDGTTIELELLSNGRLRVVSASIAEDSWKDAIKAGTVFR